MYDMCIVYIEDKDIDPLPRLFTQRRLCFAYREVELLVLLLLFELLDDKVIEDDELVEDDDCADCCCEDDDDDDEAIDLL